MGGPCRGGWCRTGCTADGPVRMGRGRDRRRQPGDRTLSGRAWPCWGSAWRSALRAEPFIDLVLGQGTVGAVRADPGTGQPNRCPVGVRCEHIAHIKLPTRPHIGRLPSQPGGQHGDPQRIELRVCRVLDHHSVHPPRPAAGELTQNGRGRAARRAPGRCHQQYGVAVAGEVSRWLRAHLDPPAPVEMIMVKGLRPTAFTQWNSLNGTRSAARAQKHVLRSTCSPAVAQRSSVSVDDASSGPPGVVASNWSAGTDGSVGTSSAAAACGSFAPAKASAA